MQNRVYSLLLLFVGVLSSNWVVAQNKGVVENVMRSNNKIYVVMAVCVTILLGLILYIIRIDKKIARIEDKQ